MTPDVLHLEGCQVDLQRNQVVRDGTSAPLTTMERDLLAYLAAHPSVAVPREVLLAEVWGYSGDVASRAVDSTIKRLRPKIEQDAQQPTHLITVHGVGYRFEPAQCAQAEVDGTTNLVRTPDRFIGRGDDLATLDRHRLTGVPLVTLTGSGGVGKTRLAQEWGLSHASGGAEVRICDLVPARDEAGILRAVAAALEVPLAGADSDSEVRSRLANALADRGPVVLVLDNAEQVTGPVAGLLTHWMRAAPEASFVVTTRERLRIRGEVVVELDALPTDDAIALFVARASQIGADVAEHDPAVRGTVERLDGLPLAIELAAARATLVSPAELLARLRQGLDALGSAPRGAPDRHRTLHKAIAWSWALLSAAEREALAQCSVFRAGFTVASAEAVVRSAEPTIELLQSLRDKSMLLRRGTQLVLGTAVRTFAGRQLDGTDRMACEARHAAWYSSHYDPMRLALATGWLQVAPIAAMYDDYQAAMERCVGKQPDQAARAALTLDWVVSRTGPLHTRRALLAIAIEANDPALQCRGHLSMSQIAGAAATDHVASGLVAARRAGSLTLQVFAHVAAARLHAHRGELEASRVEIRQATECAEGCGDLLVGSVAFEAGRLEHITGARDAAHADYSRALDRFGDAGEPVGEAWARYGLGFLALDQQELDDAERQFSGAIDSLERAADGRADSLRPLLGLVKMERGELTAAISIMDASLAHSRSIGDRTMQAEDLFLLGYLGLLSDRLDEAGASFDQARALAQQVGDRAQSAVIGAFLAVFAARRGDASTAGSLIAEAQAWRASGAGAREPGLVTACSLAVRARLGQPLDDSDLAGLPHITEAPHRVRMALRLLERAQIAALGDPRPAE